MKAGARLRRTCRAATTLLGLTLGSAGTGAADEATGPKRDSSLRELLEAGGAARPFDDGRRGQPGPGGRGLPPFGGGDRGGGRSRGDPGRGGDFRRDVGDEPGGSIIRLEGGGIVDEDTVRTARETGSHSTGTPSWENTRGFEPDVFTFTRVIFRSNWGMRGGFRGGWTGWVNDYPDSDLNLSWRLQMLTSLKVNPDGRVLKLTSPDLPNYLSSMR
jgi:hypothetical protein